MTCDCRGTGGDIHAKDHSLCFLSTPEEAAESEAGEEANESDRVAHRADMTGMLIAIDRGNGDFRDFKTMVRCFEQHFGIGLEI